LYDALGRKLQTLQRELLIESAYFVVRDRGIRGAGQLQQKGVRVRVLTNSLASNDVVAAHAGYAKRRKALVENGVELYELRPDSISKTVAERKAFSRGESNAALHTKAIVFDRESVFVGSYNLDPRSADINTEMGLYVESPELARQVMAYMDEGVLPYNAYRVQLDEDGRLVWKTVKDGEPVVYTKEPETTFGQHFTSGFIRLLPVEGQL
jgi:putative cardiolipin synthase